MPTDVVRRNTLGTTSTANLSHGLHPQRIAPCRSPVPPSKAPPCPSLGPFDRTAYILNAKFVLNF